MSSVTFSSISKRFGDVIALQDFTLSLNEGELVTLLGPSGCGKTTALRIAAGFETSDAGTFSVGGVDVTGLSPQKRNMGMVFQNYSLFPHLTVRENIEFGLSVRKQEKSRRLTRVNDMLELVQLGKLGARFPHQLSGGQQQRVALARALAIEPSVLLLDEPLSALDARVRTEVRDEIRQLQQRTNTTTLFVTHDQDEAVAISDRICVMGNGTIHQVGTPRDVYMNPSTEFAATFIGESDIVTINEQRFLVRPEDVSLVAAQTDNSHLGYVKSIEFLGTHSHVVVMLDHLGQEVRSVVPHINSHHYTIGDAVGVRFRRVLFQSNPSTVFA
jgi:putative spermidine/putrescine transport system ATP-binding protein